MTIFRRRTETRTANWFPAFKDLTTPVHAGVSVNQSTAVDLPVVYRCVALNSETIASFPIDSKVKRGGRRLPYPSPLWLTSPNDWQTFDQFVAESQVSLDLDGNCYWLKAVDGRGQVVGLYVLPPESVKLTETTIDKRSVVVYVLSTGAGQETFAANEIVHLRGVTVPGQLKGLSPIACAKQTIGIGIAAEEYNARFYGNGAHLSGVVEAPQKVEPEVSDRIQAMFTKKHGGVSKSHAVGVLTGGAVWKPLSVKPDEAMAIQSAQWTATQIAYMFGIPPVYVTQAEGAKGYVTSVVESKLLWLTTGLTPRIVRIERALSALMPGGAYVKFNLSSFLRSAPAERADYYNKMAPVMGLIPDEIRELEDYDPLPGGIGENPLRSVQYVWDTDPPPLPATDTTTPAA